MTSPTTQQQHRQQNITITVQDNDDDQASMQILPMCNYDSLRKHASKSSSYELRAECLKSQSNSSIKSGHVTSPQHEMDSEDMNNSTSLQLADMNVPRNNDNKSISQCNRKHLNIASDSSSSSSMIGRQNVSNSCRLEPNRRADNEETNIDNISSDVRQNCSNSNKIWPGERLSPDDSEYSEYINENDKLLSTKEYPTIERTKKKCKIGDDKPPQDETIDNSRKNFNKKVGTNSKPNSCAVTHHPIGADSKPPNSCGTATHPECSISCCNVRQPISAVDSEVESEETQLLQCESKKWEPLLRHNSTTNSAAIETTGVKISSPIRAL